MTNGSGSICQRHGSADPDPDPQQTVMDQQYWFEANFFAFQAVILKSTVIRNEFEFYSGLAR